jgi:trk system potassium uptake protein TrkA
MPVSEMAMRYRSDVIVCTIERGEESYIANGDFVFQEKDIVSIVASHKSANEFFSRIHYKENSIKNAMIAGGGDITHYLCEILEKSNISLKVIEKDRQTAEELAEAFPKVNVIRANPTRKDFLMEEQLDDADAFVALSEVDEENILLSLFAKEVCEGKIVTRINRTDYDSVISRLELDTTICPKNITSDIILRFVRATKNAMGSSVETMYNIIQDEVEASEFIVKEGAPIIGIPLSQLRFKENVLVASIYRNGKVIIPRGGDSIQAGDAVVIVTKILGLQEISDVLR